MQLTIDHIRWAALSFAPACGTSATAPPPVTPATEAPALEETPQPNTVVVRAILIAWAHAEAADEAILRDENEAEQRAQTVAALARQTGSNFAQLMREYSDGSPDPLVFHRGEVAPNDVVATRALDTPVRQIEGPIRTPRGYVVFQRQPDE